MRKFLLWTTRVRVAGRKPPVAPLRNGLLNSSWSLDSAGLVSALHGLFRFRHLSDSGLAHNNISSLFRGRRDFRRLRHGLAPHVAGALDLQAARGVHVESRRCDL